MKERDKILVTGGLGYIGSHTCVSLYKSGYEPIIVDDLSNSSIDVLDNIQLLIGDKISFHQCDCRDIVSMTKVFEEEINIKGIIHFAAFKSVNESVDDPIKYYDNNINGLLNILKCIDSNGVDYFVFSSSCTVYGIPDNLPVTESEILKEPTSPYGWTKYIGEKIIHQWSNNKKISPVLLRYFNPIGAHPSGLIGELPNGIPNNLVPYVTQCAAGIREFITVYGDDYETPDGTCIRDYIHVCDLADAHVFALDFCKKNKGLEFFNIGTGEGSSVKEILDTFQKVNNIDLNYVMGKRRSGDVDKIWASTEKANKMMGWKSKISIDEALKDSWNWEKKLRNIN
jgi:UDP-glucose 4-epimerase